VVTLGGLLLLAALMEIGQSLPLELPTLGTLNPATLWMILLLAYCFVASVLPVQYLLQPRDYLSSFVLFATIGCGILGILLAGPVLTAEPYHGFTPSDWPAAGAMWPMLFVTIACGAISGFHSVVSSGTTCKQIASEAHACRIGYGAMLVESMVAVLVLIAVGGGLSAARHAALLRGSSGAVGAFGEGYGAITRALFGEYGKPLAIMALNFFMLTTLDTATRLARYLLQEITGVKNRYLPTLVVIGLTALLAFGGRWRAIWPVFGASNQLVGALALLVTSCWLLQNGRRIRYTLVPALLLLVTTIGAFVVQIAGAIGRKDAAGASHPNYLIAIIDAVLVVLAVFVLVEAGRVLAARRSRM
jgi:carbon starvation protein